MSTQRTPGVSDGAMLAAIGCMVGVGAMLWLWGGIAGVLFGHGWPPVAGGQLPSVLLRLPARLADPATAWPAPARPLLPGPVGFYAALIVLVATGGVAALAASRAIASARPGYRGARWARAAELRMLRGSRSGARLALGRQGSRVLWAEQRHALVAFGPPQSGKSAGLAVPALLEWQGPAVASSIKTDLLGATAARRRQLGRVFVFDPFGLAGEQSDTWSPLRGATTWDGTILPGARRAMRRLAVAPGVQVAFISGRAVPDLAARVRVGGAEYLGNHGLERGSLPRGGLAERIRATTADTPRTRRPGRAGSRPRRPAAGPRRVAHRGAQDPAICFHFRTAPDVAAAAARVLAAVERTRPGARAGSLSRSARAGAASGRGASQGRGHDRSAR